MIARTSVLLPYAFTVPKSTYRLYESESDGYRYIVRPPIASERAEQHSDADEILVDGSPGLLADVLIIDFIAESFDRSKDSESDPPVDIIKNVCNEFLMKVRYVTAGAQVKPFHEYLGNYEITYLDDEGNDLPEEDGLVRSRGGRSFHFPFVVITPDVWDKTNNIHDVRELPAWRFLLLDAESLLPEIGASVVLCFTALEVFISQLLERVAMSGKVDKDLWEWINDRDNRMKNPDVMEQLDFLSLYLIGKSLKSEEKLWEKFSHIRQIRNNFVHEGQAIFNNGKSISTSEARDYIRCAHEITEFFREEIDEAIRWPSFQHKIKLEFTKKLKDDTGDGQEG